MFGSQKKKLTVRDTVFFQIFLRHSLMRYSIALKKIIHFWLTFFIFYNYTNNWNKKSERFVCAFFSIIQIEKEAKVTVHYFFQVFRNIFWRAIVFLSIPQSITFFCTLNRFVFELVQYTKEIYWSLTYTSQRATYASIFPFHESIDYLRKWRFWGYKMWQHRLNGRKWRFWCHKMWHHRLFHPLNYIHWIHIVWMFQLLL